MHSVIGSYAREEGGKSLGRKDKHITYEKDVEKERKKNRPTHLNRHTQNGETQDNRMRSWEMFYFSLFFVLSSLLLFYMPI